jgi:NADPH2:quinone reductase
MQKRITVTGSTLRPRTVQQKAVIAGALRAHVWPLLDSGKIRPLIHAMIPLAHAAEAHTAMESGAHIGKIVLAI